MSIYAIILAEPNAVAWARVEETWKEEHHFFTDRIAFVNAKKGTTTLEVSEIVGMRSKEKVQGIVLEADSIAGWAPSSLGEWIEKNSG